MGTNTPAGVAGTIDGAVDYTPWLDNAGDVNLAPGFQGDYSILDVDDDSPQTGAVGRIQEGVDLVSGSTINVAAGTYDEQVEVTKNVTIQGVGSGDRHQVAGHPRAALSRQQAGRVRARHGDHGPQESDRGRGRTGQPPTTKFIGVAFRNAGGTVENCTVTGVSDTPFSGAQHGVGIYAYNDDGTAGAVTVQGCTSSISRRTPWP